MTPSTAATIPSAGVASARDWTAVAHEFDRVVVFCKCGEAREQVGLLGVFDVLLEHQQTLRLNQFEDRKLQSEQFDVGLLVVTRALEQRTKDTKALFEDGLGVADDEGADGRTQDDDGFKGLPEDFQMAAHGGIAPKNRDKNYYGSGNQSHAFCTPEVSAPFCTASLYTGARLPNSKPIPIASNFRGMGRGSACPQNAAAFPRFGPIAALVSSRLFTVS